MQDLMGDEKELASFFLSNYQSLPFPTGCTNELSFTTNAGPDSIVIAAKGARSLVPLLPLTSLPSLSADLAVLGGIHAFEAMPTQCPEAQRSVSRSCSSFTSSSCNISVTEDDYDMLTVPEPRVLSQSFTKLRTLQGPHVSPLGSKTPFWSLPAHSAAENDELPEDQPPSLPHSSVLGSEWLSGLKTRPKRNKATSDTLYVHGSGVRFNAITGQLQVLSPCERSEAEAFGCGSHVDPFGDHLISFADRGLEVSSTTSNMTNATRSSCSSFQSEAAWRTGISEELFCRTGVMHL